MKELDPGHHYALAVLDFGVNATTSIRFVKRTGPGYPGNADTYPGTNIQEVLRALIARVQYLNRQEACDENEAVIEHLRQSLASLELRAARRHGRRLNTHQILGAIELEPICGKCGHIGCEGNCRETSAYPLPAGRS